MRWNFGQFKQTRLPRAKIVEGEADAKSGEAIGKFNHSNGIHHSRFMNFDNEIKLRIGAAEAFQRGEKSWAENFFWVTAVRLKTGSNCCKA